MEKAIRYSKKREAILRAIRSTSAHPTAEWIYQTIKPDHPDLSLGTVYRNLLFFQQQGTVQSVGVVNGQEHFDWNTQPHSHFVCQNCGAILDLHEIDVDSQMEEAVSAQYEFVVQRHELTFYGVCKECQSQEKT